MSFNKSSTVSVFQMPLSMCLLIVGKELWTELISSNFQNSTFEVTTITVTDIVLIQVFFFIAASKQRTKNEKSE